MSTSGNQRVFLIALFVVGFVEWLYAVDKPIQKNSFHLISKGTDGWVVEYIPQRLSPSAVMIDGQRHLLFPGVVAADDGGEGAPQLPMEALTIGIPPGAHVRAELAEPVYEDIPGQLIAPAPSYQSSEDSEAVSTYHKNALVYSENRFFPSKQVAVDLPVAFRYQRVSTIRVAPYLYNPATRLLKRLVRGTIRISLLGERNRMFDTFSNVSDPYFEEMYKSLIWNYEEAKQWRQRPTTEHAVDPTRDWFETGRTYYRINIASDGWYKVTKADLAAAGAITASIDVPTLRMFNHGVEIALFVRPDTTIEFYALRNYGDSTYSDFYTDTNAYWLTWGGVTQGLRYSTGPQPAGSPGDTVLSARETRHFEQNTGYFFGLGDVEVTDNGPIPGEGWFWSSILFPGTYPFSFGIDTVDVAGGAVSTLRARLYGTSPDFPGVDHHARFLINDSLAGEVLFEGRAEVLINASFPTGLLTNGTNVLKVVSVPTPSFPSHFYFDWFEIDYQRHLRAVGNQLRFSTPASGSAPVLFRVAGFTNPQIDVFDLSSRRLITGGIVSGDSTIGFTVEFRDTVNVARSFLVLCSTGQRSVPPLSGKTFADIRLNPQGADYIVITHRVFEPSAQTLASHRQVVNGVRAKVIDVQDVYDEFNYGNLNANAVKSFLKYAYQQWPGPAPTYVLLFGDASWDFHKYMPTSEQVNYVPAYGVPSGDNWFGCFDSAVTFIPSLLIGRLPVTDPLQAQRTVSKVIGYDGYTLDEWNKNFLFITGGNTLGEQNQFNDSSNAIINSYVSPPPIGGTPFRVYKSSLAIIDGENKQLLRSIIRDGVVFLNFLGHSGGNVWGVDVGDPNTLENTNGRLPFVSSVSCNVGAFAHPAKPLLAEKFVLADNRAAIAAWASSSLGYAREGGYLVRYFLSSVVDSIRDFGGLTTAARFRLWQNFGNYYVYVAMVKLNPLLGDPLSRLALPLKPDLATNTSGIIITPSAPSPNDTSVTIKLKLHNYGLVPTDSVGISMIDTYNGQTITVLGNKKLPPTLHHDSLSVSWDAVEQVGRHTLTTTLDPANAIDETNELNNVAAVDEYIYANILAVVRPLDKMVVLPGPQTMTVTSPIGLDSVGFQYFFELDTLASFDSPFLVTSGGISPGPVKGEWTTPSLAAGHLFFWRARTMDGTVLGNWVTSSFSTSVTAPAGPLVRLREYSRRQFAREMLAQTTATDSGVTIGPRAPIALYSRSLGYRAVPNDEYFSMIRLNDINFTGYWWVVGNGFMVVRVNEFDGTYDFRSFDTATEPAQAESMVTYLRNTPNGNFLAISVVFDGRTNVHELLYDVLQSLGSTMIRQALPGQSWAFIGRKGANGPGMAALESLTNDSAVVSLQVPNYYSVGSGSVTTSDISIPSAWETLQWDNGTMPDGRTNAQLAVLGMRSNNQADTLRVLPHDSMNVSLAFLNPLTSGPTYQSIRLAGLLSSTDALLTPSFKEWSMDLIPPADLAVSARSIGGQEITIPKGSSLDLPITIYNIGYRQVDSARVIVSIYDRLNRARPIASREIDSIPVGGSHSLTIPIVTSDFSRRVTLQVSVSPPKRDKDLVTGNNVAYYSFTVAGTQTEDVQMFADGARLMDGDFVPPAPKIVVRFPPSQNGTPRFTEFFVDGKPIPNPIPAEERQKSLAGTNDEVSFTPILSDGWHELKVRSLQANGEGMIDTLEHRTGVKVKSELQIMQMYNYPNPFSRDTYFTFVLSGARPPDEVSIRVFTVAGRRIREIPVPRGTLQIGFNRVYWDGRDTEGDEVANGYYFYQVTAKGDGKVETAIEKLAKIR